ncbi:MAG: hypothetical protein NXI24_22750 [bacterium]|nr:hypothetical protein [bacterium]
MEPTIEKQIPPLRIQSDSNFIEFERLSYEEYDWHLSAIAEANDFRGSLDAYCVRADVQKFVQELHALNESLSGSATLHAISPKEFELKLFAIDRPGHIGVTISMQRNVYGNKSFSHRFEGGFEIEPNDLNTIEDWFTETT